MACEYIRETVRADISDHRQSSRDKEISSKRKELQATNLGRNICKDEVILIGNKLKNKSSVQIEDLAILKLALFQNTGNIFLFLRINGALHGLIRELSSTNSSHQLVAAECCCNMALGDARSSLIVAKAAGPYLITMLDGINFNLMNVSVWALGNLAGSDKKTWEVVHAQGFLGQLLKLIATQDDKITDQTVFTDIKYNALEALSQLLRVGLELLKEDEFCAITTTLASLTNTSVKGLWLSQYLLSCSDVAEQFTIEHKFHVRCLNFMQITDLNNDTVASFTCALRAVANLAAESSGTCCTDIFSNWRSLEDSAQKIFSSPYQHLVSEMRWLFGNILNHPSPEVQSCVSERNTSMDLLICQFKFFTS